MVAATAACGGGGNNANQGGPSESPKMASDIAAFEKDQSLSNWEALHEDILKGPLTGDAESRIVEIFATKPVPRRIVNAAVIDLSTVDWAGTMKWIHQINVAAKIDPEGAQMVKGTARLAWLMLTLRASYANDFVDLSRTDLKADDPFVGQSMNLTNVDFSGSELRGGKWHNSNLTNATFNGTGVDGALQCINCTWGSLQFPGVVTLTDGKWVPR